MTKIDYKVTPSLKLRSLLFGCKSWVEKMLITNILGKKMLPGNFRRHPAIYLKSRVIFWVAFFISNILYMFCSFCGQSLYGAAIFLRESHASISKYFFLGEHHSSRVDGEKYFLEAEFSRRHAAIYLKQRVVFWVDDPCSFHPQPPSNVPVSKISKSNNAETYFFLQLWTRKVIYCVPKKNGCFDDTKNASSSCSHTRGKIPFFT